ncbi:ATP-grasp domain-containing protein [Anaerococcus porci]|uniref:ATP-grasp domain-containing protein n=1 Tax=Anaerococcus porci TaxID=2652269 RepID=UPI002A74CB77|nr:ATP-grasp domain-containing protein [Anaerococcus porci]MDY3006755.1 ATP-grasp domain-containing protein [Anaerococcus porci]
MNYLKGKKILFLGASTYFYEAAKYAKVNGAKVIAIDRRPRKECVVKQIADEEYSMDTTDVDAIVKLIRDRKIDGIYPGASEVNIPIQIEVALKTGLNTYCTKAQWEMSTNKDIFKDTCIKYDLQVTPVYKINNPNDAKEISKLQFPIVTKPVDNNGSTGITICEKFEEFSYAYNKAKKSSKRGKVLVEKKMNYKDSLIAHYTAQNGEIIFCGLTDKESKKIDEDSAPVMSIQFMPSKLTNDFKKSVNNKIINMLKGEGLKYGPIWIEIFYDGNNFILNEIGYRYGGSLTYYPVDYFFGINQMHILMTYLATGKDLYDNFNTTKELEEKKNHKYCILPLQVNSGIIKDIIGLNEILSKKFVYGFIQSHIIDDIIEETGTTSQVFGYIHLVAEDKQELLKYIDIVNTSLKIIDEKGNNMLDILYCRN